MTLSGNRCKAASILNSALDAGEWSAFRSSRFKPTKCVIVTKVIGSCVNLRAGLDTVQTSKYPFQPGTEPRSSIPKLRTLLTELHCTSRNKIRPRTGSVVLKSVLQIRKFSMRTDGRTDITFHYALILGASRKERIYEGVSKGFRTARLERELQMAQLSATRCSCIAIL
jgi:hypothetical protein